MSVRRLHHEQPDSFAFSKDNEGWAKAQIEKFPAGRQASAVIPLLWRAQEQEGWVSEPTIRVVAEMLDMPTIRVLEVATFYTMFQLAPVGNKGHIQVCGTTPCKLRGADELISICKSRIADHPHTLSTDGDFSWEEVECLGACVNGPMVEIGSDTYEDLDAGSFNSLIDGFAAGKPPEPGPQNGRTFAMPSGGQTSLTDEGLFDGSRATEVPSGLAAALAAMNASDEPDILPVVVAPVEETPPESSDGDKPPALDAPVGGTKDNLKEISGVGPKIEEILNSVGVFHFRQIADWTEAHQVWVDGFLNFKGRIKRDDWIAQANVLAEGGDTDFSMRVEAGEVASSKSDGEV